MNKTKYILILLLLATAFPACNRSFTKEEFQEYVKNPKNGLVQEKELNGTTIKLAYKPYQLLAMQEIGAVDSLTKEKQNEIMDRYHKQHYFLLSFSQGGKEILANAADRQRFSQMVQQFSFGMSRSVILTTAERDTLSLIDFHAPRYYGMSPSTDILLVFEKKDQKTKQLTLFIKELGLVTGNTRFKIQSRDLKKISNKKIKI